MECILFLLDITPLSQLELRERAYKCIDTTRQRHASKYKKERDVFRALGAGLLIQLAWHEYECANSNKIYSKADFQKPLALLDLEYVLNLVETNQEEIVYKIGEQGKPYWDLEAMNRVEKEYPYFNLSHSGDYVILAMSKQEVGIDIQEPRKNVKLPNGTMEFSRMESYLKCTGQGFSKGYDSYIQNISEKAIDKFHSLSIENGYVACLCFE